MFLQSFVIVAVLIWAIRKSQFECRVCCSLSKSWYYLLLWWRPWFEYGGIFIQQSMKPWADSVKCGCINVTNVHCGCMNLHPCRRPSTPNEPLGPLPLYQTNTLFHPIIASTFNQNVVDFITVSFTHNILFLHTAITLWTFTLLCSPTIKIFRHWIRILGIYGPLHHVILYQ